MQRDLNKSSQSGSRRNSNSQQRVTFIEEAQIAPFLAVSFGQQQRQFSSDQKRQNQQQPLNSLSLKYQPEDWGRHHPKNIGQQDRSDELHFDSKSEFNEDTLRRYPKKGEEENKNQANLSNESITMRGRKKEDTNSPKIKDYLTQMIVSQEKMQPILVNSFTQNNNRSNSNNRQREKPNGLDDTDQQRTSQVLPVPAQLNKLSNSSLSCSEIAYLKQKQQNQSKERAREEKQKRILKDIAFFYQKLAADKKQNQSQENNELAHFQSVQHKVVASLEDKRVHSSSLKRIPQKKGDQGNNIKKSNNRSSVEVNKQSKQFQNTIKTTSLPRSKEAIVHASSNLHNPNNSSNEICSLFGLLKLTPVQMNYFEKSLLDNRRDNSRREQSQNIVNTLSNIRKNCLNEVLNGAKEVVELGESYFTIMHDLKMSKQEPKESIMLLQDIKLRLLQNLFFAVLGRMQTPYVRQVRRRIESYQQKREAELRFRCFSSWQERARKSALKLRLVKVARREAQIKLLASGFTALKLNVQELAFYRPIFTQIKQKRNQITLKNCLDGLSKYVQEKRLRNKRTQLCIILANQHVKTKSFLILKAFSCLKKSGSAVQVVTSQNVTTRKIAKHIRQINQELQQKKNKLEDSQIEDSNNIGDLDMLERHFVCEEEYLTSARQLQKVQRELTLDKISQLKYELDRENLDNNNRKQGNLLNQEEDIQKCNVLTQLKSQVVSDIRKLKMLRKSQQKIINESQLNVLRAAVSGINKKKKKAITVNEQHFMLKLIEESQTEKLKITTYFKWRIAFLKRQIDRSLDMMVAIQAALKGLGFFRDRIRNNEEICQLHLAIKEEKVKSELFSAWKSISNENSQQSKLILEGFKMKQCFRKIKCYVAHQRIQRMADNFHRQQLLKKLIDSWSSLSQENQGVRALSKRLLAARTFRFWHNKYKKVTFLRNFFSKVMYSPSERIKLKYPTDKSLLRNILHSWKLQVVDNDNTIQQQLNTQTAVQHRKITLKTKIFFEWQKITKSRKALEIIFNSDVIAKGLFNRLVHPWRSLVQRENNQIEQFIIKHNNNSAFKALHALKMRYFRNRIAKITYLRKFFQAWKKSHVFICYVNPQQIRTTRLLRASFTGFIMKQLEAVRYRTKIEKSTQLFLCNIKKFLSKCMLEWQQYTLKRRSKNLLQVKLKKYAEKQLKKRAFNGFSISLILRRLKRVQNEKARQFRHFQDHKHFDLQIQAAQNSQFYSPGYQLFLGIIHYWRLFAIKQKTITRISKRILKFKARKTLQDTFQKWCDIYNKKVSSKSAFSAQYPSQITSKHNDSLGSQIISENKNLKNPIQSQKIRPASFDGAQPFLPSANSPSKQDNIIITSLASNQTTLPRQISEAQMHILDSRKSPKDSKGDNNLATLKIKQAPKTVRFELEEEQKGKGDFYSQKYMENEAFYQRLISSKK